jgi:hypothetical protein
MEVTTQNYFGSSLLGIPRIPYHCLNHYQTSLLAIRQLFYSMNCSGVTIYGKNWWMKQTGTPNKSAERTLLNRKLQNAYNAYIIAFLFKKL